MTKPTQPSVTFERVIAADIQRVFTAFSDPHKLCQWFSPAENIHLTVDIFEFTPQGKYRLEYGMPDGTQPAVWGTFEVIEFPNEVAQSQQQARLVLTWIWEEPDPHANILSRVEILFNGEEHLTHLSLTHRQIPTQDYAHRHQQGWFATLARLPAFLEHSIGGI